MNWKGEKILISLSLCNGYLGESRSELDFIFKIRVKYTLSIVMLAQSV